MKQDVRLLPSSVDGQREASWIVADYLDVVLHIFTPEARGYYRLEELWGDAPPVEVAARLAARVEANERRASRAAELLEVRVRVRLVDERRGCAQDRGGRPERSSSVDKGAL